MLPARGSATILPACAESETGDHRLCSRAKASSRLGQVVRARVPDRRGPLTAGTPARRWACLRARLPARRGGSSS